MTDRDKLLEATLAYCRAREAVLAEKRAAGNRAACEQYEPSDPDTGYHGHPTCLVEEKTALWHGGIHADGVRSWTRDDALGELCPVCAAALPHIERAYEIRKRLPVLRRSMHYWARKVLASESDHA